MNYTCAVYENAGPLARAGAGEQAADPLRLRQDRRRRRSVLDIGCGWGAALEYAVSVRGVKRRSASRSRPRRPTRSTRATSPASRSITTDFISSRPRERFDSLVSIGMMDHLCSPEQARQGKAVDIYRKYFKSARADQPGRLVRPPDDPPQPHAANDRLGRAPRRHEERPRGHLLLHEGDLPGRAQPAARGRHPGGESVLRGREVKTRRDALRQDDGRVAPPPPHPREDDPLEVGQTRSSTTTTATSTRACAPFDNHYSSLAQYELRRID